MVIKRTPPRYPRRGPSCLLVLFVIFGVAITMFVIQNADEVRDVIIPTPTPEPTRSATEYALLAEISQKDGSTAEAIGYYRQALRLDATKPEIYIRYIELLVEYGCASLQVSEAGETINCIEEALARSRYLHGKWRSFTGCWGSQWGEPGVRASGYGGGTRH
jgi:hypothetical protein